MKKRFFSILLVLCMVISIVPAVVFAASEKTFSNGEVLENTIIEEDTIWTVPAGVTVEVTGQILVKNGATLTLNGSGTFLCKILDNSDKNMIYVDEDATLVINGVTLDGNRANGYKFIGIRVQDGTCTMNSGTIKNFERDSFGAAIYVSRNQLNDLLGTFNFNGGTITGNKTYDSTKKQGGPGIYNMGVVVMNGGTITGNTSASAGGAVYNGSDGEMTINGGTITGNTSTKLDENGTVMANGIFNSSNDSSNSILAVSGEAVIDDVYLDNTNGDKVLFINSALKNPLTIYSLNINEGKVLAEGKDYTLTKSDMALITCGNKNAYLGMDEENNQIFMTYEADEAYYPVSISSDDDSLTVELYQNGTKIAALIYDGSSYSYSGNLKAGSYDVYVNGIDTGKDIVISGSSENIFDASYLEIDAGATHNSHAVCGHADAEDCPDSANHTSHEVSSEWIAINSLTELLNMEDGKNYYLADDITASQRVCISGTVNLCLNGFSIVSNVYDASFSNFNCAVYLEDNTTFNVSDCKNTGKIKNTSGRTIVTHTFGENITFNLFGGIIESTSQTAYLNPEAFENCVFNQYGGTVRNTSTGQIYTVDIRYGAGKYNLYGGTVKNTSGEIAIGMTSDDTQLSIKGEADIIGMIITGNPIVIECELSKPSAPIKVLLSSNTGIFTSGWNTYMASADYTEYFAAKNSDYVIKKDSSSGELKIEKYQAPSTNNITGTVTITGTQVVGNTLTAVYEGNAGENVTYMWYRDGVYDIFGQSSNGKYYNLGPNDIGAVITVSVRGKSPYSGSLSAETGIIQDETNRVISGSVKTYGDETANVTIELWEDTEVIKTVNVTGNDQTYSISDVVSGIYTIRVSKSGHCTKEYDVVVSDSDVTQDLELWMYGDANHDGKIDTNDSVAILRYVVGYEATNFYAETADINGDGTVDTNDSVSILRKVVGYN